MNKRNFSSGRWKDLFVFTRREKNGILILFILLAAEACTLLLLHYLPVPRRAFAGRAAFEKEADAFMAALEKEKMEANRKDESFTQASHARNPGTLFLFDPNELTAEQWKKLAVSDRLASTLEKYVSKGGRFRKKEDLKKIYGMTIQEYKRLAPYVHLSKEVKSAAKQRQHGIAEPFDQLPLTDVGIADTIELLRIHGIGVVFARRIHKYREKLGGFYCLEQLKEVYGMTDTLYEKILPQIALGDTGNVRLLDLNNADYATLRNHPYVGRDLARIIVNYRLQHGAFQNGTDVRKIPLVSDELYRKLAPYFKLE